MLWTLSDPSPASGRSDRPAGAERKRPETPTHLGATCRCDQFPERRVSRRPRVCAHDLPMGSPAELCASSKCWAREAEARVLHHLLSRCASCSTATSGPHLRGSTARGERGWERNRSQAGFTRRRRGADRGARRRVPRARDALHEPHPETTLREAGIVTFAQEARTPRQRRHFCSLSLGHRWTRRPVPRRRPLTAEKELPGSALWAASRHAGL